MACRRSFIFAVPALIAAMAMGTLLVDQATPPSRLPSIETPVSVPMGATATPSSPLSLAASIAKLRSSTAEKMLPPEVASPEPSISALPAGSAGAGSALGRVASSRAFSRLRRAALRSAFAAACSASLVAALGCALAGVRGEEVSWLPQPASAAESARSASVGRGLGIVPHLAW